ncbi:uncharacterized protein LOC124556604 [Schistocerca americana]|uniref:uncharacterized protein LOC124556604 n=1 Tax=Schistocerca americana TaxID=7009 RepID=UPI001F4F2F0D|nr:uncharacterized protein LOC124556604 [Schistocerca americana]
MAVTAPLPLLLLLLLALAVGAHLAAAASGPVGAEGRRRCPLCDSSVYSYCSEKLLHDACCCSAPLGEPLPYQCQFADCSFLHAKSCRDHRLITACCCTSVLFHTR